MIDNIYLIHASNGDKKQTPIDNNNGMPKIQELIFLSTSNNPVRNNIVHI